MATDQRDAVGESLVVLAREFPGDPKVLYITTRYYSELANRTAQELIQKAPSSPEAETLIAEAFQAQGKWDDAAAQFRKILEQNPNQPGIHYQLGRILLSKPLDPTVTEEATKEFEAELKINPTSPAAEFMLGDLAWRNQKADEAIEHFSRATQFDAGLAEAYLGLGMALNAAGKYSEAITPLKKYTDMDPSDPAGYYQLATAYARTGNKPEADRLLALQRQMEKNKPRMMTLTAGRGPAALAELTTADYFHFPSPSTMVMYRSRGKLVKRSVVPPGCGHFTSSQSILVRCPRPSTRRGSWAAK